MKYSLNYLMNELRYDDKQKEKVFSEIEVGQQVVYNKMFANHMLQGITDCKQCNYNAKVLILADRLNGIGIGLQYYFTKFTKLKVCGVASDFDMALKMSKNKTIDMLIIIGYQRKKENYQIVQELKAKNSLTQIIFWATIDTFTESLYRQYHMDNLIERDDSVRGLILLIKCSQKNLHNYICSAK